MSDPRPQTIARLTRRRLVGSGAASALALGLPLALSACGEANEGAETSNAGAVPSRPSNPDPRQALELLQEGNRHYVEGKSAHPRLGADRRREVAGGQEPFALVIGCVDSRVAPELVFDQGLGDILTARMPGNFVDDEMVGTAQFSVAELGAPLIMVLGHSSCGAVTAAVDSLESGEAAPGEVGKLVDALAPAVRDSEGKSGDHVDNAVRRNVALGVGRLREADILAGKVEDGSLMVVGAYYDLASGRVESVG